MDNCGFQASCPSVLILRCCDLFHNILIPFPLTDYPLQQARHGDIEDRTTNITGGTGNNNRITKCESLCDIISLATSHQCKYIRTQSTAQFHNGDFFCSPFIEVWNFIFLNCFSASESSRLPPSFSTLSFTWSGNVTLFPYVLEVYSNRIRSSGLL